MTTIPIAVPTIHLNGTSRAEIISQISEALIALRAAEIVLCRAKPHGRDYYPQSDHAISQAISQHRDRLSRLNSIITEYEQIAEGIS